MLNGNYSKNATIERFIAIAHRRAVVFYKLCRHKVENKNLPGTYTDYLVALASHLKKTITNLNALKDTDFRKLRERNKKGIFIKNNTSSKRGESKIFSRIDFDNECRKIIEKTSSSITQDLQIK